MLCFYSFCRLLDDSVDNSRDMQDAALRLSQWRDELDRIYSEDIIVFPNHPVSRELALYIKEYDIEKQLIEEIIKGQEMDITGQVDRPSDELLDEYCYRVASCVGLVSIQIFGYRPQNRERIKEFAIYLGKGLQLVNILRDIREDAVRGRIYLPGSLLDKYMFAYSSQEVAASYDKLRYELVPVMQDISLQAEEYFNKALENLPQEEYQAMKPGLLMMKVYKNYLHKMKVRGFIFERKEIRLTTFEKIRLFI